MVEKTNSLKSSPTKEMWKQLATVTLARTLIFNKRRADEPARMLIEKYNNRADKTKGNEELESTLPPLEKKLLKT